MERGRGNPLRPLCDGCGGRWQGLGERAVEWRGGRRLCVSCSQVEEAARDFGGLSPEERRLTCPRVEDIEEGVEG